MHSVASNWDYVELHHILCTIRFRRVNTFLIVYLHEVVVFIELFHHDLITVDDVNAFLR